MKNNDKDLLSNQTTRDILSFFLTFLIYLPLLIWWTAQASEILTKAEEPSSQEISLELDHFQKEECIAEEVTTDIPVEKIEEPKEEIIEEIIEEEVAEEPIEEEIVPEPPVEPEPVEVVSEQPKPLVVEKPKLVERVIKKRKVKKVVKKKKKTTSRNRPSSSSKRSGSSSAKNRFMARLKAKINANKSYPRIAQKRGMKGNVKVRFRITAAGKVSNLTASGPRVFVNSAKNAVKKSFPLSTRGVSLPMNVTFTLNYHLKK